MVGSPGSSCKGIFSECSELGGWTTYKGEGIEKSEVGSEP